MENEIALLVIAIVILGYGYSSDLLLKYNISGPMIFMSIGVLLSPLFFGSQTLHLNSQTVQTVATLALIIVLFSDASGLNLKNVKWGIPVRLLFIGLPLTIVFAAFVAMAIFPNEPPIYLLLMSLILAPTDAALGKAVVTDKAVPEKISSSINIESGLNDGIVFPILLTVSTIIASGQDHITDNSWIPYVAKQIVFGAIVGSVLGYINAKLTIITIEKKWISESYKNLMPLAIAILSYYIAEQLGGNGFIAAFFAGLIIGNYNEELRENIENFAETEADLLLLVSFMVFGFVFIPATIAFWNFQVILFAVLSLTVLRMIPVAISLIGTKFDLATVLFIGWFGPRGIASLLYVLIVVSQIGSIKGHEEVYATVTVVILLSIILHGITARPFVKMYSKNHK